eukprot:jgi/Tetstr1/438315/TSEL_026882.t1
MTPATAMYGLASYQDPKQNEEMATSGLNTGNAGELAAGVEGAERTPEAEWEERRKLAEAAKIKEARAAARKPKGDDKT